MIELTHTSVMNFENAIRGMRNPLQSYEKSDSFYCGDCYSFDECKENKCPLMEDEAHHSCKFSTYWDEYENGSLYILGKNDLDLAKRLCKAGNDHRKFLREILVSVDIKAPLYWWKEYDTYKVATVANSTSTMHTIHKKEFTLDDFSHERIKPMGIAALEYTINILNYYRNIYLKDKTKDDWYSMIQLLPSSYNQLRTCTLNYEVLRNIYHARCHHKLDCWKDFCKWVESLPYAKELIIE